jgi:D-alanine-D-alanine ligase
MVAVGRPVSFRVPEGRLLAGGDEILFDVAFPVLHGPYGEDGTIQGTFDMANTPYVGCGVTASALAMEKDFAKQVFSQQRIPTARWVAVHADDFVNAASVVELIVRRLGLPVFVKPAELGSSVGVAKAVTEADLKDAISDALSYGHKAIVEEFIDGREIEVAVLGGRASVPGEIVIQTDWYDYESKYNDESSQFVAPARLTPPQSTVVRDLAERAFQALGCKGLARVDFFFEERGRGFVINEINTMPGFTPISGFPTMWHASGMTYGELCDELVQLALRGD